MSICSTLWNQDNIFDSVHTNCLSVNKGIFLLINKSCVNWKKSKSGFIRKTQWEATQSDSMFCLTIGYGFLNTCDKYKNLLFSTVIEDWDSGLWHCVIRPVVPTKDHRAYRVPETIHPITQLKILEELNLKHYHS